MMMAMAGLFENKLIDWVSVMTSRLSRWELRFATCPPDISEPILVAPSFHVYFAPIPGMSLIEHLDLVDNYTGYVWHFAGLIDEVQVFDRGLTPTEIKDIYVARVIIIGPGNSINCTWMG